MKKSILYSLIAGATIIVGLVVVYLFGAFFSDSSTIENIFSKNNRGQKESGFGGLGRQATKLNESDKINSGENSKIFVTALDGSETAKNYSGKTIGCNDKLYSVNLNKPLSPRDTLVALFEYPGDENKGIYNVFENNPVIIDSFDIKDGVAIVHLSGNGLGSGTCDMPRISQQLDNTLLQFDNIKKTEVYFDNQPLEKYLSEKDNEALRLEIPEGDKIYFGAFPDFGGPEDNVTAKKIEDFDKLIGKRIFWAYFSNNWGKNRDGVKFPRKKVEAIASTGTIPFVRMMPRQILDTAYDKTFSLQKIIEGNFDEQLHQYARDVKDYGRTVLMDFGLEMNGNWFPWSGAVNGGGVRTKYGSPDKADGPERFVDSYRHIVDIFREEGVKNVTWFWHPDVYSEPDAKWNRQKEYYPGDDYVDWIGISAYGPQNPDEDYWDSFPTIMKETQNRILEITNNKPIALLEFGVTDHHPQGRKAAWLAGAFKYILDKNSPLQFKAISPWHENWEEDDDLWATLRLDSSASALATFKKNIANERFVGGENTKENKNIKEN